MELSEDQKKVFDCIIDNIKNKNPLFTTGGYAGTGKTFLISEVRKTLEKINPRMKIAFVTFTGKASSVLKQKLVYIDEDKDYLGTIHSLIYRPEFHFNKKLNKMIISKWNKVSSLEFDLIIIDEASMVSEEILNDLKSFNIPIWAVGDHGQLPPVSESSFCLMKNPDYTLEKIHRQAEGNPIIQLADDIRKGIEIPYGFYMGSKNVFKLSWQSEECKQIFHKINFNDKNLIILCGMNKTRVVLNKLIRNKLGFIREEPYIGERVICLKNNHSTKIMNGMTGTVMGLLYEDTNIYNMTIEMDNFENLYDGLVFNGCFGKEQYGDEQKEIIDKKYKKIIKNSNYNSIDLFDFSYCISVHRAQGSEWNKVILFVERSYYWNDDLFKRWNYTSVTRSIEKLFIITL
jgi:exodeoxyribonuclease-5